MTTDDATGDTPYPVGSEAEQLYLMLAKIDNEGLDYFLAEYGSTVPDIGTLRKDAQTARLALEEFESTTKTLCEQHGVTDYEL